MKQFNVNNFINGGLAKTHIPTDTEVLNLKVCYAQQ